MTDISSTKWLTLLVGFSASVAVAQEPTDRPLPYDYVIAGLALTELDLGGFEVAGSFTIAPNVHLIGSYQDWELNENFDRSLLQVGGAYHWDVAPNLDIVGKVTIGNSEIERRNRFDFDETGLILGVGLRGWVRDDIELSSEVLLDDTVGSDIDTVVVLGGQYLTSPEFSLGGRIRIDEEETTLFLGLRYSFGRNNQP